MPAADTIKSGVTAAKSKIGDLWDQAKNSSIGQAISTIIDNSADSSQSDGPFSVVEIGKPFMFTQNVDPLNRTHRFLLTRMNSVDLYPCNYAQAFLHTNDSGGKERTRFRYGLNYKIAMQTYRKMCSEYIGGGVAPSALRVFLTDDTVVTDGVTTQYSENFFQSMADKLSNMTQNITNMAASMNSSRYTEAIDSAIASVKTDKLTSTLSGYLHGLGLEKTKDTLDTVVEGLKQGAAIVLKGNKLSLPKIWQNSNYTPSFSVSTKLFSPYGSPKAIKENIIKPLTYLLLMAVPHSDDMVSYGRPFAVTVRAWGNSFLSLAGITSITLQRGGTDSSYNIYKQPLTVNVNIQFGSLVDGMIAFSSLHSDLKIPDYEKDSYATSDQILRLDAKSQTIDGSVLPTVVPTVGGIIRSFQPVAFAGVNNEYTASHSTRDDVMIGGNTSSAFSALDAAIGFMSSFNAAFNYATDSALTEASFGKQVLDGVTGLVSGAAYGATMITKNLNNTVGQLSTIANAVSLGAFNKTPFAQQLRKTQSTINQNVGYLNQSAAALNTINNVVQTATFEFGSIMDVPVR